MAAGSLIPVVHVDFNTQPSEATYRFLTGYPLSARQERELKRSMVIHESVDKLNRLGEATPKDENQVPGSTRSKEEGEDEDIADGEEGEEGEGEPAVLVDEEGHASRVMKGVREAKREDGLLTVPELISLFSLESSSSTRTSASEPTRPTWKSAYGLSHGVFENERTKWFGERRVGMWMVPMKDLEVQPEGTDQDPQAEATGTGENARAPTKKQEEAAKATTRERAVADPRVKAVPVPLEDEEEEAEELKGKTWDEKALAGYYEPMWSECLPYLLGPQLAYPHTIPSVRNRGQKNNLAGRKSFPIPFRPARIWPSSYFVLTSPGSFT